MPSPSPEVVSRILDLEPELRGRWRRFWAPPEQFLLDAGKTGELLIARIRVALTGVLLFIPLTNLLLGPGGEREQHFTGLVITLTAFVFSLGVYGMVTRDRRERWLPMATALFDVTFISAANLTFAFTSDPHVVVNSKITFDTYFIAIGATALRYDKRVALTDAEQALERVEQIRQAVQSEAHQIGDARPVHITVSAGVACWPQDGSTVGDLVATADRRLFEARDAGRNRVIGPVLDAAVVTSL